MNERKCKKCGELIQDDAKFCPNCGEQRTKSKMWLWIVLGAILILAILFFVTGLYINKRTAKDIKEIKSIEEYRDWKESGFANKKATLTAVVYKDTNSENKDKTKLYITAPDGELICIQDDKKKKTDDWDWYQKLSSKEDTNIELSLSFLEYDTFKVIDEEVRMPIFSIQSMDGITVNDYTPITISYFKTLETKNKELEDKKTEEEEKAKAEEAQKAAEAEEAKRAEEAQKAAEAEAASIANFSGRAGAYVGDDFMVYHMDNASAFTIDSIDRETGTVIVGYGYAIGGQIANGIGYIIDSSTISCEIEGAFSLIIRWDSSGNATIEQVYANTAGMDGAMVSGLSGHFTYVENQGIW
ncbi:putative nucleic acid-binding Zn ribbon protein [Lachnospiraceae bacterium PF1-22]|uniref:zinc-ribbon domain-containing protein n=1 Tax=Ohessyouella blattaphilus TaxID=2949333 RepID=UPI003E1ED7F7